MQGNGLLDQDSSLGVVSQLVQNHTEEVHSLGVLGLLDEESAVQNHSLFQPATAVVVQPDVHAEAPTMKSPLPSWSGNVAGFGQLETNRPGGYTAGSGLGIQIQSRVNESRRARLPFLSADSSRSGQGRQ